MKTTPTTRHLYTSDGITPQLGEPWCTCGRPKRHPAHSLPSVPAEVLEAEQRRMGETE